MAARADDARDAVALALQNALRQTSFDLTSESTVVEAAERWLAHAEERTGELAPSTLGLYRWVVARVLSKGAGEPMRLSVREFNHPSRTRDYLHAVASRHGVGVAKSTKAVLSGTFEFLIGRGVVDSNNVRHVRLPRQSKSATPRDYRRALTVAEAKSLQLQADRRAADTLSLTRSQRKWRDTADLINFMLGTGVRISEALALRWEDIDLVTGRTLVRGTKTAGSQRVVTLPKASTLTRLQERSKRVGCGGFVFALPTSMTREDRWQLRSAERALRQLLDEAGLTWAVTHTFRRSVATWLDEDGVPIRRIADQLGHASVRTTIESYLGRDLRGDKQDLAAILERHGI